MTRLLVLSDIVTNLFYPIEFWGDVFVFFLFEFYLICILNYHGMIKHGTNQGAAV